MDNIKKPKKVDFCLIWLTRFLVLSLPIMLFNPMYPVFHRLQISELFFVITLILFLWQLIVGRVSLPRPGSVFIAVFIFILFLCMNAYYAVLPKHSFVEVFKIFYLFMLACLIYCVGWNYNLRNNLWKWMSCAFMIVIACGALGIILLCFDVHTFLAYKTRIISLALGVQQWLPFVPRVSSVLQPTGNMTGAYFAGMTLPALVYLFNRPYFSGRKWLQLVIIAIVCLFGFLTMSRTFVGVLLALYLGLVVFTWAIPCRKFFATVLLLVVIVAWLSLLFFSVLYPVKFNAHYSTNQHYKKELVVLKNEKKPNPVYFMRKGIGLENIDVSLSYAINHYAWLKYGGFEIFKRNPFFGVGLGNYSQGMKKIAKDKVLSQQLTAYLSAQSQYATLLAETGGIGTGMFVIVIMLLLSRFLRRYLQLRDPLDLAVFASLLIICLIAVNVDVIAFRWLWGLIGLALIPPAKTSVE